MSKLDSISAFGDLGGDPVGLQEPTSIYLACPTPANDTTGLAWECNGISSLIHGPHAEPLAMVGVLVGSTMSLAWTWHCKGKDGPAPVTS